MTATRLHRILALSAVLISAWSCVAQTSSQTASFDVLIKGGTVYDGTGGEPRQADIGIRGDRIVAVGNLKNARAGSVVDASALLWRRTTVCALNKVSYCGRNVRPTKQHKLLDLRTALI